MCKRPEKQGCAESAKKLYIFVYILHNSLIFNELCITLLTFCVLKNHIKEINIYQCLLVLQNYFLELFGSVLYIDSFSSSSLMFCFCPALSHCSVTYVFF